MINALPRAKALLGDKDYDADRFRSALAKRKIAACIPSKVNRKVPIPHHAALYRQRHKIEIMLGILKDWRRNHLLTLGRSFLEHRRNGVLWSALAILSGKEYLIARRQKRLRAE